ncbi:MAG: hypothetical protein AAFY41_14625, partial [Bacteroidota bacterium]
DSESSRGNSESEAVVEKFQERVCSSYGNSRGGAARANSKQSSLIERFFPWLRRRSGSTTSFTCRTVERERTVYIEVVNPSQEGLLDDRLLARLESNVERGHRIGAKSLELLQQVLITQTDGLENNKVLEVSELAREFEYGRISPLLQVSNPTLESVAPTRMDSDQIIDIAREQKSTIVYYSVVDSDELYIWVINPEGKIDFKPVPLAKRLRPQIIATPPLEFP